MPKCKKMTVSINQSEVGKPYGVITSKETILTQSCTGSIHKFLDIHKRLVHCHHDELLLGASGFTEQGLQAAVVLLS